MSLAAEIGRVATDVGARIRRGTVQSATGSRVTVRMAGVDSPPLPRLAAAGPATGEEVAVLVDDGGGLVVGVIGGDRPQKLRTVGTWFTNYAYVAGQHEVCTIVGTVVQDVDASGDITVGLGTTVGGIWAALAVGGDALSMDPLNCNLHTPGASSFRVSLSNHNGPLGDTGLVRVNFAAWCWI